jgi:inorganic pyrophosphatase
MRVLSVFALLASLAAVGEPPAELPAGAVQKLQVSLRASRPHPTHVWRDTAAINTDGTINAYVEIPRGERRKWEFDMAANASAVDRMIPADIGGYPVNYGFVPQTVSYDGDPFDALVLGPPLANGTAVRGVPVALMQMRDGGIVDAKVVLSPVDGSGRARRALSLEQRQAVAAYFSRYKRHEPGAATSVPGWGTAVDGRAFVQATHAFFLTCRDQQGPCTLAPQ